MSSSRDEIRYDEMDEVEAPIALAEAEDQSLSEKLSTRFGDGILSSGTPFNEPTVVVSAAHLHEVMGWLQADGFLLLSDLTAWDDFPHTDPRFWVVYQLTNISRREILCVKVGLPEKKPEVDSVTDIWPGADFMEREVYDLMGVIFKNHPNLKRIMLPDEWDGHPLRRDYPEIYEEVQFTHNFDEIQRRKPFATE